MPELPFAPLSAVWTGRALVASGDGDVPLDWTGRALREEDERDGTPVARLDEAAGRWVPLTPVPTSDGRGGGRLAVGADGDLWLFRTYDWREPRLFGRRTEGFEAVGRT